MTEEAYESDTYLDTDKVQVFVYSITKHPVCSFPKQTDRSIIQSLEKELLSNNNGREDIDSVNLKDHFVSKNHHVDYKPNVRTKKELLDDLQKKLNSHRKDQYGAYLFVFLSFLKVDTLNADDISTSNVEERICLYNQNETFTVNEIWDNIKSHANLIGKPKVFLVQADDERLLRRPQFAKGGPVFFVTKKIPQEADRITLMSTIPQPGSFAKVSENGTFMGDNSVKDPSFLIKAFIEVMKGNAERPSDQKIDILSQTVTINNKLMKMIKQLQEDHKEDPRLDDRLDIQTVTSTLTKLLKL